MCLFSISNRFRLWWLDSVCHSGLCPRSRDRQCLSQTQNYGRKIQKLNKRYLCSVLAALGLALCANKSVASHLSKPSSLLLAGAVALCSGPMASCVSFQFCHLPPTVANTFDKNKAVCLSLMDRPFCATVLEAGHSLCCGSCACTVLFTRCRAATTEMHVPLTVF